MKMFLLTFLCFYCTVLSAQLQQLQNAMDKLEADEQFRYSTIALVVKEAGTGKMIYNKNGDLGVVPASSLKVVTSATAFDLLEKDFTFPTTVTLATSPDNDQQAVFISGWGDPTFGSHRWKQTTPDHIFSMITEALQKNGIRELPGGIFLDDLNLTYQPVPEGWIWEDIGNYFGAGAWGLNWKENVFEIDMIAGGDPGDPATVLATRPEWMKERLMSFVRTGTKGSGDQSLVFSSPYQEDVFMTGTIPPNGKITIGASMPDPAKTFGAELKVHLQKAGIKCGPVQTFSQRMRNGQGLTFTKGKDLFVHRSPSLESMNYWFMNKSINLYGEAFVKTFALHKKAEASTENGIEVVRNFWQVKGINKAALKMVDGSGLSPTNRVTANSLVFVLEYARTRPWFNEFYRSFPEMNGMKLKSGYMSGVRSYTGMVTSRSGKKYSVAFIINNFEGDASAVRQKMWRVLDHLQ